MNTTQLIQGGLTLGTLSGACWAITEAIKRILIAPWIKDTDPRQNSLVRVVAFTIAWLLIILDTAANAKTMDYPTAWHLLPDAIFIFLGGTGTYKLADVFLTPGPPGPAPAPPPAP